MLCGVLVTETPDTRVAGDGDVLETLMVLATQLLVCVCPHDAEYVPAPDVVPISTIDDMDSPIDRKVNDAF